MCKYVNNILRCSTTEPVVAVSAMCRNSLCSAELGPVLETLEYVKHETDCWLEITTLLIPGRCRLMEWMPLLTASRCAKVVIFRIPRTERASMERVSIIGHRPCKAVLPGAWRLGRGRRGVCARSFPEKKFWVSLLCSRAASSLWRPARARTTGGEPSGTSATRFD